LATCLVGGIGAETIVGLIAVTGKTGSIRSFVAALFEAFFYCICTCLFINKIFLNIIAAGVVTYN
jgi:hypothetical protein